MYAVEVTLLSIGPVYSVEVIFTFKSPCVYCWKGTLLSIGPVCSVEVNLTFF